MLSNPAKRTEFLFDIILIPTIFLAILLLGNYGIFLGHNFFVDEPAYTVYGLHLGNTYSSGWRPDIGLGQSFFFGDPGTFHVWALFRWWHHLFPSPLIGHNVSVIALLWTACLAQFIFLRKALPNLGRVISVFLACLIAFGPERYNSFFYQSYMALYPIALPLISLILYDFSIKPSLKHYFSYTLTLTLGVVLGSYIIVAHLILFSCGFFLVLVCFQGWHKNWPIFRSWLGRFILLNLSAGFSILVLAAWTFYSIFVEHQLSHPVRDANYAALNFFSMPWMDLKFIFHQIILYAQPGFLSPWSGALGPQQILGAAGQRCFSILLPIVLLIALFHKPRNFWEYSFKYLFIGTILYKEFFTLVPGLMNMFQYLRPPLHVGPILQVLGILGLGVCLSRVRSGELEISGKISFLIRCVALPLSFVYIALFMVALFSIHAPESLNTLFLNMWGLVVPYVNFLSLKNLMPGLILENVRLFHETMGMSYLLFYGSALAIMGLFSTRHGIDFMKWRGGTALAGILLVNHVFLSWAIYPMNSKPPIWQEHFAKKNQMSHMFAPTDRIMRVGRPLCSTVYREAIGTPRDLDGYDTTTDYLDCVKRKFLDREFGPRRFTPGYMNTLPIFELSIAKSYTPYEVSEFMKTLLKLDFPELKSVMGLNRSLQRDPPIYSSKLYDIVGVKYLLSQDSLEETDRIKLVYSSRQFFLYQYLGSWPYFYLADRIETIANYEDLFEAKKGTAYLWTGGPKITLQPKTLDHTGIIKLTLFEFDQMKFDYESDETEFLVLADAWHPNWRAKINGIDTEIVKTNGVFKGILLPPGKGRVHLYFDSSSYRPGIWISLVGWILFIGSWIGFSRQSRKFPTQDWPQTGCS